jgi:hypothetical protein
MPSKFSPRWHTGRGDIVARIGGWNKQNNGPHRFILSTQIYKGVNLVKNTSHHRLLVLIQTIVSLDSSARILSSTPSMMLNNRIVVYCVITCRSSQVLSGAVGHAYLRAGTSLALYNERRGLVEIVNVNTTLCFQWCRLEILCYLSSSLVAMLLRMVWYAVIGVTEGKYSQTQ